MIAHLKFLKSLLQFPIIQFGFLLLIIPAQCFAQEWPIQPIKIIVPFPAAGGTDALARTLGNQLSKQLKQPVIIENKAGANGVIGAQIVATSPADGYTILLTIASHAIAPSVNKKLPFSIDNDFIPVSLVAKYPYLLTVSGSSKIKSFKEFVEFTTSHPNQMSFASSGNGSAPHLGMELLMEQVGIQLIHVPYKGAAPANNDLLGGSIDCMLNNLLASASLIRSNKLRVLATTSGKRSSVLPNIPTIKESGYPNFEVDGWYGIFMPAKTPDYIVQRFSKEVKKAIQDEDVQSRLKQDGAVPIGSTPKEFQDFFISDKNKWSRISHKINLQLE